MYYIKLKQCCNVKKLAVIGGGVGATIALKTLLQNKSYETKRRFISENFMVNEVEKNQLNESMSYWDNYSFLKTNFFTQYCSKGKFYQGEYINKNTIKEAFADISSYFSSFVNLFLFKEKIEESMISTCHTSKRMLGYLNAYLKKIIFFQVSKNAACVSPSEGIKFDCISPNAKNFRIGIVKTMWNAHIVDELTNGVYKSLQDCGVKRENIVELVVPGSYELPYAAKLLSNKNEFDAIICIGCLIKGDSMHFEYIADAVSHGIMKLQLSSSCPPIVFGVLTCMNIEQAKERTFDDNNHGLSWGKTAVHMAEIRKNVCEMNSNIT